MKNILMTGASGTGKSTLLHSLAAKRRLHIVDPLGSDCQRWSPPKRKVDAVVFDHLQMIDAATQVDEAKSWCRAHSVNIVFVTMFPDDLAHLGIHYPDDGYHVQLKSQPGTTDDWISLSPSLNKTQMTSGQVQKALPQLLAG